MEEVYKDIEGYEGLYQVSNLGNVKSFVDNNGVAREKVLKPRINGRGYLHVDLCKNKKKKIYLVHRLVAQAFIENPNNLPIINHKDECKTNNIVTNIEWCTQKYNCNYGTGIERHSKAMTNNQKLSKSLTNNPKISKAVGAFKDGKLVLSFPSIMEAQRQGFNHGNVWSCCIGERKSHKGYEWRYL